MVKKGQKAMSAPFLDNLGRFEVRSLSPRHRTINQHYESSHEHCITRFLLGSAYSFDRMVMLFFHTEIYVEGLFLAQVKTNRTAIHAPTRIFSVI